MQSIQSFSTRLVADIVRRQPPSAARTAFAWQLAVGPALARVTTVELVGRTLHVRSADARWLGEVRRARTVILPRMQHLLGADAVGRLEIPSE